MDAIIYLRISQDRTGEGLAVDRQRADAHRLAELRGYRVVAEVVDNDISAAGKVTRPGFERVVAALASKAVAVVVAWDMTRLTRNRRDTLRVLEVGERAGATLAFVRGSDLDLATPAGRLTADILAGVARHEIEQKADRQRSANAQAAADGRWRGGRRPFGYESDGVTVREPEAVALATTYRQVAGGAALAAVARSLNAAGLPTPQPRRDGSMSSWTAQTLRTTLLNPRYAGLRAVGTGPRSWRVIGPAVWPALVDEPTWEAVDAILRDPYRRSNAPRYGSRLLTGLAWCGWPGCTSLVHAGANPQRQPTYRCRQAPGGGHISRRADPVDGYIGLVVVERMRRPDAAELLVARDLPDLDQLTTRRKTLRGRRRGLARLLADGTLTEEEVRVEADRLDRQIAELSAQIEPAGRTDALAELVASADPAATWRSMDVGRRRAAVDTLMTVRLLPVGRGTRTFRPATVEITPKR